MPGGNRNIKPSDNTGGFHVNPQNINKKGAPKKTYKQHITEIEALGYVVPTPTEFWTMVGLLSVMTKDDLKAYETDNTRPAWIQGIISDMFDKNTRSRLLSDYRDWIFGKAKESLSIEHEIKGSIEMSDEQVQKIIDALKPDETMDT